MQRFIPSKNLYFVLLVVVTTHEQCQVRTIGAIHKHASGNIYGVTLLWNEGSRLCGQHSDAYCLYKPTLEQIEYSIQVNGRLANKTDVCEHLIAIAKTTETA